MRSSRDRGRHLRCADDTALRNRDDERRENVLKLSNVARPIISRERANGALCQDRFAADAVRRLPPESRRERRDVLHALAKRRHVDANHVETIQQVLPEPSRVHQATQRAIRRSDEARVERPREVLSDTTNLPLLQDAQDLRLSPRRQLTYLVKEHRASLGALEQPEPLGCRAGKCALRMTEQFGVDEIFGHRRAIESRIPALAPAAGSMNGPRHKLLPRSALPFDEHRERRIRRAGDGFAHLLDGGARAHQIERRFGGRRHVLPLGQHVHERSAHGGSGSAECQRTFSILRPFDTPAHGDSPERASEVLDWHGCLYASGRPFRPDGLADVNRAPRSGRARSS